MLTLPPEDDSTQNHNRSSVSPDDGIAVHLEQEEQYCTTAANNDDDDGDEDEDDAPSNLDSRRENDDTAMEYESDRSEGGTKDRHPHSTSSNKVATVTAKDEAVPSHNHKAATINKDDGPKKKSGKKKKKKQQQKVQQQQQQQHPAGIVNDNDDDDDDDVPLTLQEQEWMTETIITLAPTHLYGVIQLIREGAKNLSGDEDEIDLEIDQLDTATQRKLLRYVTKFHKPTGKKPFTTIQQTTAAAPRTASSPVNKNSSPSQADDPQASVAASVVEHPTSDSFFSFGRNTEDRNASDSDPQTREDKRKTEVEQQQMDEQLAEAVARRGEEIHTQRQAEEEEEEEEVRRLGLNTIDFDAERNLIKQLEQNYLDEEKEEGEDTDRVASDTESSSSSLPAVAVAASSWFSRYTSRNSRSTIHTKKEKKKPPSRRNSIDRPTEETMPSSNGSGTESGSGTIGSTTTVAVAVAVPTDTDTNSNPIHSATTHEGDDDDEAINAIEQEVERYNRQQNESLRDVLGNNNNNNTELWNENTELWGMVSGTEAQEDVDVDVDADADADADADTDDEGFNFVAISESLLQEGRSFELVSQNNSNNNVTEDGNVNVNVNEDGNENVGKSDNSNSESNSDSNNSCGILIVDGLIHENHNHDDNTVDSNVVVGATAGSTGAMITTINSNSIRIGNGSSGILTLPGTDSLPSDLDTISHGCCEEEGDDNDNDDALFGKSNDEEGNADNSGKGTTATATPKVRVREGNETDPLIHRFLKNLPQNTRRRLLLDDNNNINDGGDDVVVEDDDDDIREGRGGGWFNMAMPVLIMMEEVLQSLLHILISWNGLISHIMSTIMDRRDDYYRHLARRRIDHHLRRQRIRGVSNVKIMSIMFISVVVITLSLMGRSYVVEEMNKLRQQEVEWKQRYLKGETERADLIAEQDTLRLEMVELQEELHEEAALAWRLAASLAQEQERMTALHLQEEIERAAVAAAATRRQEEEEKEEKRRNGSSRGDGDGDGDTGSHNRKRRRQRSGYNDQEHDYDFDWFFSNDNKNNDQKDCDADTNEKKNGDTSSSSTTTITLADNCWVKAKANINLGSCGDDTKGFFKDIWNGLWYSSWDDWDTYFDTRSPILPLVINTTNTNTNSKEEEREEEQSNHDDDQPPPPPPPQHHHRDQNQYNKDGDNDDDDDDNSDPPIQDLFSVLSSVRQSFASKFSQLITDVESTTDTNTRKAAKDLEDAVRRGYLDASKSGKAAAEGLEDTVRRGYLDASKTVTDTMESVKEDVRDLSNEVLSTLRNADVKNKSNSSNKQENTMKKTKTTTADDNRAVVSTLLTAVVGAVVAAAAATAAEIIWNESSTDEHAT